MNSVCNSVNKNLCGSGDQLQDDSRVELAKQEEQLLQALLMLQDAPQEVDAEQVTAQAESLATKRRRAIERCHPALEKELGEIGFRRHILEYFKQYPSPLECAFEDGTRFSNWLVQNRILHKSKVSTSAKTVAHRRIVLSVVKVGLSLKALFLG